MYVHISQFISIKRFLKLKSEFFTFGVEITEEQKDVDRDPSKTRCLEKIAKIINDRILHAEVGKQAKMHVFKTSEGNHFGKLRNIN